MKKCFTLLFGLLLGVATTYAQTITNASFEDGTNGWTVSKMQLQTNDGMSSYKAGNTYLERWIAAPGLLGAASVKQTVTGLSNGVYRLTVNAQNISQNNTSAAQVGAWIVGNGLRTAVTTLGTYTLDFFVTDGTAEIGFVCDGASGNWVGCDNFTLTYRGNTSTYIQSAGNTVKNYANNLISTYGSDSEYSALISTLTTAINGNNLTTVANAAKAVVNGERAYRLRHPSGTEPTVTTNKRHARGSIWIFGRFSQSGSDVVEEGFCWSTSPNPTISDNHTTDWIYSNGKVIWIDGLTPGTMYYVRAYAMTRGYAVGYGDVIKVPTLPQGQIHWSYGNEGDDEINTRITNAASWAFDHYWSNLTQLTTFYPSLHYASGTPTADCSYGGWTRIGPNTSYQRSGTIMHEALHGVGVGTHSLWGEFIRNQYPVWDALRFWDNNETSVLSGDSQHLWPYGINGASEDNGTDQLYIGNSLICEALGEAGLPLTESQWLLPYYAFPQEDNTKYYIKCEDKSRGLVTHFLTVDSSGNLKWKEMSTAQAKADDKAAWYITFDASTQRYQIKNASTNRYIRYSSANANNGFTTGTSATDIQMKKCRVDVNVGSQTYQGYYFLDFDSKQTMEAKASEYVGSVGFNIYDDATTQRWVILALDELDDFESGAVDIRLDELRRYINGYTAAKNVSHTDKTTGATTALTNTINNINSAISGTVTMDQVNQYISDIKSAGLTFLQNTKPASGAYYDLTFLIENPSFTDGTDGWSLSPTYSYGAVEFYQTTFDLYQILPDMPAGLYQFSADAFQRPGANADVYTAYTGGTDNVNAVIYMNSTSQKIKNVMAGAQAASVSNGEYETEGGTFVPNNMESGSAYLARNYYNNVIQAEMASGDLRIGVRGTVSNNYYWAMADNFKLYYLGSEGEILSLKDQLVQNGFTKLTELPNDYSPYFFVLYDHDQDLVMVPKAPNHQGGSKSMWYDADINPTTSKEPLWTLDSFMQDDVEYQVMANATYPDYMLQTEWNAGWYFRASDNGAGNPGWGRTKYEYLSSGYWTIQNGVYPDAGYLGPWDNIITDDAETALNKTGNSIGHFDVFSILRGDYVTRFDQAYLEATYDNPYDITYVLENPGGERRNVIGWKTEGNAWAIQNNDALTGKAGNYYMQRYDNVNGTGACELYQQIYGLPDGYYQFSVIGNCSSSGAVYANGIIASLPTNNPGTRTTVTVQVIDGETLRVGVKALADNGSWVAFDDAKLEYLGTEVPSYNVGNPTCNIQNNSYQQNLQAVTLLYNEANSNVEGAVFSITDNTKMAALYKDGTKVGELRPFLSGKTVTLSLADVEIQPASTYRIEFPAGTVGYQGQLYNEDFIVTWHTPLLNDGTYYLLNNSTQTYFSRNGAWNTQAVVDNYGLAVRVETATDGNTRLRLFDNQLFVYDDGNKIYADGGTGLNFSPEQATGGYRFKNKANNLYLGVSGTDIIASAAQSDASAVWTLEPTSDHAANYTRNADTQAAQAASGAGMTGVNSLSALESAISTDYSAREIAITGAKAEQFQQYAPTVENSEDLIYYANTIQNLTPGIYRLSADAFQRAAYREWVTDNGGARGLIFLYANDAKTQIKSMTEYGASSPYDVDYEYNGQHFPDNEASGYAALETGNYKNVVYVYVPADDGASTGTLNFGIRIENRMGNGVATGTWTVYDNFKLEYISPVVVLDETSSTAPAAATDVDVRFNRSIIAKTNGGSDNAWNTICLPFSMDEALIKSTFGENTRVMEMTGVTVSGGNATFTFSQTDAIEANKPYIMQTDQEGTVYNFTGIDITPSENLTVTKDGVDFVGNYINQTVLDNAGGTDYYILNDQFKSSTGRTKIKGFRAYFHVLTAMGVKSLSLNIDGETTGIDAIDAESAPQLPADIYSVGGQLIRRNADSLDNLPAGVYIVNGKKFIKH